MANKTYAERFHETCSVLDRKDYRPKYAIKGAYENQQKEEQKRIDWKSNHDAKTHRDLHITTTPLTRCIEEKWYCEEYDKPEKSAQEIGEIMIKNGEKNAHSRCRD